MEKLEFPGKCYFCNGTFSKAGMTKHLKSCVKRKILQYSPLENKNINKTKLLHIVAEGKDYLPEYWLHLEAPAFATLEDLDILLREIWLECCGHASIFKIDEERYFVEADEQWEQKSMDIELGDVLTIRKRFYHDYDFGSPTHLMLRVVLEREGEIKNSSIKVLARNDPPLIKCQECDKLAVKFCTGCSG